MFQYVVSSYAPSLTALVESFKRSSQSTPRILVVSMPNTPHYSDLPGTLTEVEAIKDCVGSMPQRWLNAETATIAAVLKEMEECNWCHFACHGIQHKQDPTKSAFALYDGHLELNNIMSMTFKFADLAFLTACQTAAGDTNLPEEAIHLAAGMLMAGYRTVLATMWSIKDVDGPVVAREVYTYLMGKDGMEKGANAYALHYAAEALRTRIGDWEDSEALVRWMPFIHLGT